MGLSSLPKDAATLPGQAVPDWMKRQLEPASLAESYAQLSDALHHVARDLAGADTLTPLQIATSKQASAEVMALLRGARLVMHE